MRCRDRGPRTRLGPPALGRPTDAKSVSLGAFATATTTTGAIVHTDGWQGYKQLPSVGFEHRPLSRSDALPGEQLLPRAHRAISNLKAWMHGTHRAVSPDHLPAYRDEFVFRHNRRGTPMAGFQTLLGLGLTHNPITYRDIIDQAA